MHPWTLAALAALAAPLPAGEDAPLAVSEARAIHAPSLLAGGAEASSTSWDAALSLGGPPAVVGSSETFASVGSTVLVDPELGVGPPVVVAVHPPGGDAAGGEAVDLFGFGFDQGAADVRFAGAPASGVSVSSNTTLSAVTPPGFGPLGNPLGPALVEVTTTAGSGVLGGGFVYRPGLVQAGPAHVGGALALVLEGDPSTFGVLVYGFSTPGFGLPVPPLAGSLEVVTSLKAVGGVVFTSTGEVPWSLPVPDKPGLAGAVVQFQGISLTALAPLAGSFTNTLDVHFQP